MVSSSRYTPRRQFPPVDCMNREKAEQPSKDTMRNNSVLQRTPQMPPRSTCPRFTRRGRMPGNGAPTTAFHGGTFAMGTGEPF